MEGPGAPFEEVERRELINNITSKMAYSVAVPTARAALWLCDLEKLSEFAEQSGIVLIERLLGIESLKIVPKWTQRDPQSPSKLNSVVPSPAHRQEVASLQASPTASGPSRGIESRSPNARRTLTLDTTHLGTGDQDEMTKSPGEPFPSSPSTPIRTAKKRPGEPLDSPQASKRLRRDELSKKACRERDVSCILTQAPSDVCDVAHLYPFALRDERSALTGLFWDTLGSFWSEERIQEWHDGVFSDARGTERPENLILLNPLAHRLHSKALFALEPCGIDEEKENLTLRFWWLQQSKPVGATDLSEIPELPANYDPEPAGICLYNPVRHQTIKSGEYIVVTTPDPVRLPLPDTRILDMQWVLQRLAALSGAAEPEELDDEDDDDDEGMDDFGLKLMSALQSSSVAHRSQNSPPSSLSDGSGATTKYSLHFPATATETETGDHAIDDS
ncbi:hypothetical protein AbraIFM66950_003545 [Aspergillus brasiliensis]|nr:hypothetical protein AbraIFM66950_003545 [Aspergillus brasiliensis]